MFKDYNCYISVSYSDVSFKVFKEKKEDISYLMHKACG